MYCTNPTYPAVRTCLNGGARAKRTTRRSCIAGTPEARRRRKRRGRRASLPFRRLEHNCSRTLSSQRNLDDERWRWAVPKEMDPSFGGGRTIPPACNGARCVVVDEMIYSYGGQKPDGGHLGIVYRLDPKKMEWIEVATPIEGNCPAPPPRANCCLCSIGSRLVMFGGRCCKFPRDRLQCGAMEENWWTNDVYEFELDERRESGEHFQFIYFFQIRVSCICRKVVGFGIERTKAETTSIRRYGSDRPMSSISFWNGY